MDLQELKQKEGEIVEYLHLGKYKKFKLVAVQLDDKKIIKDEKPYRGAVGDFRLNYTDGVKREWSGFWTNKIDRIKQSVIQK